MTDTESFTFRTKPSLPLVFAESSSDDEDLEPDWTMRARNNPPLGGGGFHFHQNKDSFVHQTISKDSTAGQQANSTYLLAELGRKNAARCFPDSELSIGQSPMISIDDNFLRNASLYTGSISDAVSPPPGTESIQPIILNNYDSKSTLARNYISEARERARPRYEAQSSDEESYSELSDEEDEDYYTDDYEFPEASGDVSPIHVGRPISIGLPRAFNSYADASPTGFRLRHYPTRQKTLEEMAGIMPRASGKTLSQPSSWG
ncbi:unnamed protein product [Clonostachys rosea]|uniref:Uncharacterized protein n=1 Tax=Bionectria ochroleuca TaxID=29856 RepID=A0ABY6UJK7_BIOOC|nr:unnamed protein product [Clonostachys rosea]